MFRINLLPKEVLERRRYEAWYRWIFIVAVGLILIFGALYLLLMFEQSYKNSDLQRVEEQTKQTTTQSEQLSIFQSKEQELAQRETVADQALAGRVNVGEVANDVSLVLPDEVWLDILTINQDTGVVISANTPRSAGESTDVAYKSVAKTLVRLNELPELYDVWLSTASNATWSQWAQKGTTTADTPLAAKVVTFQASGKVVRPGAAASSSTTATPDASSSDTHTVGQANAAQSAVNAANGANTGGSQ